MSLYTLTVDLLLKTGSFERDSGKAAREFDKRMASMQAAARTAGTAIGVAISGGLAAGAAAVVGWSKEVSRLGVEYDRLATLSGTNSNTFQRMAAGANSVGVSHEKLADILKDTQDKIGDFVQTGGGGMADFFENIAPRIGVTAEEFRKLSGPDALGLYFKSLERANLSQSEMTFYMEAIASDSALLIPLLKNNSEGFTRWGAAAEAAGAIIGDDMVEATRKMRDMTVQADLALLGIKNSVAEQVMPAFADMTDLLGSDQTRQSFATFTGWVAGITAELVGAVVQLGNFASRAKELYALDTGGSASDASYAALNEQLGRVNSRRRDIEGWTSNHFGIPFTDQQKASRAKQLAELRAEQERLQREITKRINADLPFQDAAPQSWLDQVNGKVDYKATGNMGRAERERSEKAAEAASKRRLESIAAFTQEAKLAAGAMEGPLAEAMAKHLGNMAEYNALLAKGNIAQADANVLMGQSALEYAKVAAEVEKALGGPESLLASMDAEVAMLGKVGRARELSRRQMMNERDMRQELQKAVEAAGGKEELAIKKGAASYEAYEQAMIAAAHASADLSLRVEEASANVEAWASVVLYGVDDAADAMADFVASGMRDFDNLWDDLKDTAKRGLRDLASQLLEQRLVIPIQAQVLNGLSGQGGGLSLQSIMGVFGGNGSAAGGQSASTVAGLLSQGQGLFTSAGGASGAAGANTLLGFGNNMAAFTGGGTAAAGGAAAASGAAGGAMAAMGAVAAFAPYAALIAMGMQMAGDAYGKGFGLEHQKMGDLLLRGNLMSGGLATPMMVDSMLTDKTLRAFGVSGKTAAIISGSSLLGKAFGRSAPKITGQGLTGSYGFGGLDGQSYADVKQKGGWFRSDKKWTQYGGLDAGIDRTFDMAARQIRGATLGLGEQLGVDLSKQLAGVKVSLGKLQLSADSAEAQQQLESYLADMQDRLYTEAVKAAGFGGQLDGYFESADVFAALGASIELAVGNADQLGRALNSLELEKVNKAVDYFQELAGVAGTDLATQIEKVSGLLGNYASLMADVSTQLMAANLTSYQSQALAVERTYRQQVKAANDYAKALGLSGARAEDLAKIEALRATNMGKLQAQIDADKKAMRYGLDISALSPLTDQQKLQETMRELERAVAGGDSSAAQAAAQAALGFGRNLYASGRDYNALYGQVTGLIDGMKVGDLDMEDGTSMGQLADAIEALPDNFSRAVFDLVVNDKSQAETTAAVQQSNALLEQIVARLDRIETASSKTAAVTSSSALRNSLNATAAR